MSNRQSSTGRTVLAVSGGALLAWLLLRGGDWSLGRAHGGGGGAARPAGPPCRVRLDADSLELDGVRADLATAVSRCRAAGAADVTATGAAIVGAIRELMQALKDAGVVIRASPDLWRVAGLARAAEGSSR